MTLTDVAAPPTGFDAWWRGRCQAHRFEVTRIPLSELGDWHYTPDTGDLAHRRGGFFRLEGLRVRSSYGPVREWTQPVINQPEIGVLGILVKRFDGELHCLMQAKMEPGNINTLQLSPTVQATRSNYTRVHGGAAVRYLEHFIGPGRGRVLADSLQSEQGSWFYRKHNRNMLVEAAGEVEVHEDFRWLPLRTVLELLSVDNLINMDTRTVLACLPFRVLGGADTALLRSLDPAAGSHHSTLSLLSWFTETKTRAEIMVEPIALPQVRDWLRTEERIEHRQGKHFRVIGAEVRASTREVTAWRQPLIQPCGHGFAGLLVRPIGGVMHALVHARAEPGFIDQFELSPTAQHLPVNYQDRPEALSPYLGRFTPDRILYDTMLSEEGGRFYDAQNRYVIALDDQDAPLRELPGYRWAAVHQLMDLVQHGGYLSVQTRSLLIALHSIWSGTGGEVVV